MSTTATATALVGPFRHHDDTLQRDLELTFLPVFEGELPEPVEAVSIVLYDECGVIFRASQPEGTMPPVMTLGLAREFAGRLDHDEDAREWLAREYRAWLARGGAGG